MFNPLLNRGIIFVVQGLQTASGAGATTTFDKRASLALLVFQWFLVIYMLEIILSDILELLRCLPSP